MSGEARPRRRWTWLGAGGLLAALVGLYWVKVELPPDDDPAPAFARVVRQGQALSPEQALRAQQEAASSRGLGRIVSIRLGQGVSMDFALIPPGTFLMGSADSEAGHQGHESPQHEVEIRQPFLLRAHEITQEQWFVVMGTRPWLDEAGQPRQDVREGANLAAGCISWQAAAEFCRVLSARTGRDAHLPTEAQWEYACRAGSLTRFSLGEADDSLRDGAWFEANARAVGEQYPHAVGQKRPNAWGLFDMHGNVMEWCADAFDSAYYEQSRRVDPAGPSYRSAHRIIRGGSYDVGADACRSASRGEAIEFNDWPMFGLRVAIALPAPRATWAPTARE